MGDDKLDLWLFEEPDWAAPRREGRTQQRDGQKDKWLIRLARATLSPRAKATLRRATRAAMRSGHSASRTRSPNLRGAGVRGIGKFAQRVVVRARVVPLRGKSPADVMRNQLAYLARDGADRDGERGKLFNGDGELEREAVAAFADRGAACRHQFRFIVSPERGGDIDMTRYTQDLARRMEHDLDTRLDYVACVHYDTDQPHVHIVVNGRDERGGDLVISRDYIGNGLRHRAMERATDELGYRTQLDLLRSLDRDVRAERYTALDRRLQFLAERHPDGLIELHKVPGDTLRKLQRTLYLGRLAYLEEAGLALKLGPGQWRLAPDALDRLRGATQHRDILHRVERHIDPLDRAGGVTVIDKDSLAAPVSGRVLGRGLANELSGTMYLVVSGIDGKTYYTALSAYAERHLERGARTGDVVTLRRVDSRPTGAADRNIVDLAERNDGVYDAAKHLAGLDGKWLPHGATPERYVEAHVLRLMALERRGFVTAEAEGRYRIPPDLIEQLRRDPALARDSSFVRVDVHGRDLETLASAHAFTWLDEQLVAGVPQRLGQAIVRTRFQNELIDAADQRVKRLVQLGLARLDGDRLAFVPGLKPKLERIEREAVAGQLAARHGRFVDLEDVRSFRGHVAAVETLNSGTHAVVVGAGRFTLVPAARGLRNQVGKNVSLSVQHAHGQEAEQTRVRFRVLDAMDLDPSLGR
jgi:type IV secretory pathway VirD2 relaxase